MSVGGPCIVTGCGRISLYGSDKCYRHKDSLASTSTDVNSGTGISDSSENIDSPLKRKSGSSISYNIDGKQRTVASKNLDDMISSFSGAKKFWTVDLGLDEDEFVQYAINNGEFEHWDDSEMLESKEMEQEEAIVILRQKLLGSEQTSGLWWNDPASSDSNEGGENPAKINGAIFFLFFIAIGVFFSAIFFSSEETLAEGCLQLLCGGGLALGGGAAALGRSEQGRFE